MSQVVKTWVALSAIGAATIHLALVVGSPLGVGIIMGLLGVAELAWGVAMLANSRVLLPRIALAVSVVPVGLMGFALSFGVLPGNALAPLALAVLLELFVAGALAISLRRGQPADAATRAPSAGRYILAVLLGSLAVASITTPALAATEAGRFAQPHGEHSTVEPTSPAGHDEHAAEPAPIVPVMPEGHTGH